MRSQKIILLAAAVFCLTLSACTKQDLNDDEKMLNSPDVYATGGQVSTNGGLN